MKLPGNAVGITDLLDYRECAKRMELGMQRHTPEGEAPGSTNWTNAYGSAIHEAISLVETTKCSNADAVTQVWPKYAPWLDPEDLALLHEDLEKYRGDTPLGYELVTAEADVRVPLFMDETGQQIYFRFTLDALYRRIDDHTSFFHRDYKSSKWRKTQTEVDEDLQLWAYNFGIHTLYPECVSLIQSYEQLRFGNLVPRQKDESQRKHMKAWLIETVKALLADEEMAPKINDFCAWCPLVLTCGETERAINAWRGRLALLAPMTKEGRKTRIALAEEGFEIEEAIARLPEMQRVRKHLEAAESAVKSVIEHMPSDERERLGYRIAPRRTKFLTPAALRELHAQMGDAFYEAVSLSRSAAEQVAGKRELDLMDELELERISTTTVTPVRR